jgi:hypothetical protein
MNFRWIGSLTVRTADDDVFGGIGEDLLNRAEIEHVLTKDALANDVLWREPFTIPDIGTCVQITAYSTAGVPERTIDWAEDLGDSLISLRIEETGEFDFSPTLWLKTDRDHELISYPMETVSPRETTTGAVRHLRDIISQQAKSWHTSEAHMVAMIMRSGEWTDEELERRLAGETTV